MREPIDTGTAKERARRAAIAAKSPYQGQSIVTGQNEGQFVPSPNQFKGRGKR